MEQAIEKDNEEKTQNTTYNKKRRKKRENNNTISIGTWNIRTTLAVGAVNRNERLQARYPSAARLGGKWRENRKEELHIILLRREEARYGIYDQ